MVLESLVIKAFTPPWRTPLVTALGGAEAVRALEFLGQDGLFRVFSDRKNLSPKQNKNKAYINYEIDVAGAARLAQCLTHMSKALQFTREAVESRCAETGF